MSLDSEQTNLSRSDVIHSQGSKFSTSANETHSFIDESPVIKRRRLNNFKAQFLSYHLEMLKYLEKNDFDDSEFWNCIENFTQERKTLLEERLETLRWSGICRELDTHVSDESLNLTSQRPENASICFSSFSQDPLELKKSGFNLLTSIMRQRLDNVRLEMKGKTVSYNMLLHKTKSRIHELRTKMDNIQQSISCPYLSFLENALRSNSYEKNFNSKSQNNCQVLQSSNTNIFNEKTKNEEMERSEVGEIQTKILLWERLYSDLDHVLG